MSSSCFAAKTDTLHINKSSKSRYSGRKIKNGDKVPNPKVHSRKVKISNTELSLSKKDLNSSLRSGNFVDEPVVNGVVNTSVVSKSNNKFLGRKRYRSEKIKKSDNVSVQRNANFQVKNDSSVSSAKKDVVDFNEKTLLLVKKTRTLIKNNPKKSVSALVGTVAIGTLVGNKIKDNLENDDAVFEEFKKYIGTNIGLWKPTEENLSKWSYYKEMPKHEEKFIKSLQNDIKSNAKLIFLYNVCKVLHSIFVNYAMHRTIPRRVWDFLMIRGAVTRQRKSVERFVETGQGTCWEAAQIFDFCCRKLGLERHHIVVSHLVPGIYHTFNIFKFGESWYLCDPLAGVIRRFVNNNGVVDTEVADEWKDGLQAYPKKNRRCAWAGNQPFGGYILEQINDDTFRTLGMVKMAPFGPSLYDEKLLGDNDFMQCHYNDNQINKICLNDNVKFNEYSSILFG